MLRLEWLRRSYVVRGKPLRRRSPAARCLLDIPRCAPAARQGRNDFGRLGYGGPCPPPNREHRYLFELYALDMRLDLPAGTSRAEVESAMQGHILGQTTVMGKYARRS